MISFRFHVVSITAVFLAIAIGVVVGSTFVDRAIVDNLQDRIDTVSGNLDERRAEIADLEGELDRLADHADATAPFAVAGRLPEETVLVLGMRGVDEEPLRELAALAAQAGATTPGIVWIEPRWALDDDAAVEELAALANIASTDPQRVRAAAWDALLDELQAPEPIAEPPTDPADPTATTQPPAPTEPLEPPRVLVGLIEAGFLSFDPVVEAATAADFAATSPGTVLVTGREADDALAEVASVVVDALVDAPLRTVVAEVYVEAADDAADAPARGEAALAAVPEDAGTAVSIVDHLDLRSGQVAAVLALADLRRDVVGHYGLGDGASGSVPAWTPL